MAVSASATTTSIDALKIGVQTIIFIVSYIATFVLISFRAYEYFGFMFLFVINIIYSIYVGKSVFSLLGQADNADKAARASILIIVAAFLIVTSIFGILIVYKLQYKFAAAERTIQLSPNEQFRMDNMKFAFIFSAAFFMLTYMIFKTFVKSDDINEEIHGYLYKLINESINNDHIALIYKLFVPIVLLGVGGKLYDNIDKLCDNDEIRQFKTNFKASFWLFLLLIILFFSRRMIEMIFITEYNPLILLGVRWDLFITALKWIIIALTVLYTYFSLRDYMALNPGNACFRKGLKGLYISFVSLLTILFGMTLFTPEYSAKMLTPLVSYIIPLVLLGLTIYLIIDANHFATITLKHIIV